MTMLYPIVLETEQDGAVSAYVPGLPVYAGHGAPRDVQCDQRSSRASSCRIRLA